MSRATCAGIPGAGSCPAPKERLRPAACARPRPAAARAAATAALSARRRIGQRSSGPWPALLLGKPVFTRFHDEALGTLGIDSRHLDEIIRGEISQIVASLHPRPGELGRKILVHSLQAEQRRVEVLRLLLARDGLHQERVARAVTQLAHRRLVET